MRSRSDVLRVGDLAKLTHGQHAGNLVTVTAVSRLRVSYVHKDIWAGHMGACPPKGLEFYNPHEDVTIRTRRATAADFQEDVAVGTIVRDVAFDDGSSHSGKLIQIQMDDDGRYRYKVRFDDTEEHDFTREKILSFLRKSQPAKRSAPSSKTSTTPPNAKKTRRAETAPWTQDRNTLPRGTNVSVKDSPSKTGVIMCHSGRGWYKVSFDAGKTQAPEPYRKHQLVVIGEPPAKTDVNPRGAGGK